MKKYKVEFIQKETFVVDVLAKNEQKAIELAKKSIKKSFDNGVAHYYQIGICETETGNIYDVSETDDPFNPINPLRYYKDLT